MLNLTTFPEGFEEPANFSDVAVIGRPGTGKRFPVGGLIVDRLSRGYRVIVLDHGRSWRHACMALGGTYYEFGDDAQFSGKQHGDTPLSVCELGEVSTPLERFPITLDVRADDLLVVDELYAVRMKLPCILKPTLEHFVAARANFCLVAQHAHEVTDLMKLSPRSALMELNRVHVPAFPSDIKC
jgi:hypothetical protein